MLSKETLADAFVSTLKPNIDAGTAAYQGFVAGYEEAQRLLQQTACYTTLELLEQKLKEATEAVVPSDDEVGLMEKDSEIAYLNQVIEYIKDLQAIKSGI